MILAAGRGERLKPLTNSIPKALAPVHSKPIICYHLEKLSNAGFNDVIINLAYLGKKIEATLGNGHDFGLNIDYVHENSNDSDESLETGGGIFNALPLLGNAPFATINADIFTDFDFSYLISLSQIVFDQVPHPLAHLILVPNPDLSNEGNFSLKESNNSQFSLDIKLMCNDFPRPYLASGITLYHPDFFNNQHSGRYSVVPLWRKYADQAKITASVHQGMWFDIGTIEKLHVAEKFLLEKQ